MNRNFTILLICLLIGPMLSFGQKPIEIDQSSKRISIPENSSWLADAEGLWFSEGLKSFKDVSTFKDYHRNAFVYKEFTGPAILKTHVNTAFIGENSFVLELRNTEIDRAQLLILEGDSIIRESMVIGDVFPFKQRYFQYRTLAIPISLESNKSYTFILGIEKKNRIISSLIELYTVGAWEQRKANLHLVYGLFFGLFVMVMIVAFSLFSIIRQRLYLYYGVYVICMMLLLGCFHGLNYQYIFPNNPGLQQYFMLIVQFLSLIFGNLYAFQFLGNDRHPRVVRIIRSILVGTYIFGLLNSLVHLDVDYSLEKVFNIVFIVIEIFNTLLLAGLSIWYIIKYKSGAATVFLVSFIFVGIAVFYTNLSFVRENMNYIPIGHSLLVGLAIEMVILTLFMIIQFKQIENEKIIAENRLVTERIKNQHAFINGQENEKKSIAIQLHDEIGSSLLSVRHQLEPIPKTEEIRNQLTNISREVRSMSHGLLPTTLDELGLVAATKELISTNGSIAFHFKEISPTGELGKDTATQVYRILQELIKNSYTHAKAENVYIQFLTEDDTFEVYYEDDGQGFDLKNYIRGIGMKSMSERASMINADLSFESTPGNGMTAMIKVKM